MLNLINNNCIEFISMDPESGGNTGDIYFTCEEIYTGEIINDQPNGKGLLKMYEKSEFDGKFDNQQITEGFFKHFSGVIFKGKFKKDRFQKGTISFLDGDRLEGEWGNQNELWSLIKGKLYNEQNDIVYTFDQKNRQGKSKLKTISASDSQKGFVIEFDHYFNGDVIIKKLIITSNGSCTFEVYKDKQHIQTKEYNFGMIPFEKEENFDNDILQNSKYCFGIEKKLKFIKQKTDQDWYIEFKLLDGVEGIGQIEFNGEKLTFKGELIIDGEEDNSNKKIEFSYDHFQNKNITIDDRQFENFQDMYIYLEKTYDEVEIESSTRERKSSKCNKPIMKELISEIKKSEDCKIF